MVKKVKHKGQIVSTKTIGIVIALVGFFLLFATFGRLFTGANIENENKIKLCRDTVLARVATTAQLDVAGRDVGQINFVPLLCETLKERITVSDPEEVMHEFAELMAQCKHMFADGVYSNVFDSAVDGQNDNCFPCFVVDTDKIDGDVIFGDDFEAFLLEKKGVKKKSRLSRPWTQITYSEYLQAYTGVNGRLKVPEKIQSKDSYVIYYSDPDTENFVQKLAGKETPPGHNGVYLARENDGPPTTGKVLLDLGPLGKNDWLPLGDGRCTVQEGAERR